MTTYRKALRCYIFTILVFLALTSTSHSEFLLDVETPGTMPHTIIPAGTKYYVTQWPESMVSIYDAQLNHIVDHTIPGVYTGAYSEIHDMVYFVAREDETTSIYAINNSDFSTAGQFESPPRWDLVELLPGTNPATDRYALYSVWENPDDSGIILTHHFSTLEVPIHGWSNEAGLSPEGAAITQCPDYRIFVSDNINPYHELGGDTSLGCVYMYDIYSGVTPVFEGYGVTPRQPRSMILNSEETSLFIMHDSGPHHPTSISQVSIPDLETVSEISLPGHAPSFPLLLPEENLLVASVMPYHEPWYIVNGELLYMNLDTCIPFVIQEYDNQLYRLCECLDGNCFMATSMDADKIVLLSLPTWLDSEPPVCD